MQLSQENTQNPTINYIELYGHVSEFDKAKDYAGLRKFLIDYRTYLIKDWKNFDYVSQKDPKEYLLMLLNNAICSLGQYDNQQQITLIGQKGPCDIVTFIELFIHDILAIDAIETGALSPQFYQENSSGSNGFKYLVGTILAISLAGYFYYNR